MASEDRAPDKSSPPDIERGTYEIIRDWLVGQARELGERAEALNERRLELFGGTEMAVIGNERIRTENNCVPRDIVAVGPYLLFGYNVFIGLKTETAMSDVLSLHHFDRSEAGFSFRHPEAGSDGDFLADPHFVSDFRELYKYYKDTRLLQLRRLPTKLLAVFQTGRSATDIKVFRWAVDHDGRATYIDNRGERDHVFPPSHDFEWTQTTREDHVAGTHPHVSILDQVFVETVGGDLTVKIEDNTESGEGVYREPVNDADQSLDDAQIHYAQLGALILLRILPYGEREWRHLIYNTRTHKVDRIDAIGQACIQLPEDHGLVFPGGYYLRSGETKTFGTAIEDMEFMRVERSPNGEDVLYVFHQRDQGRTVLLPYNLIRKEVRNLIHCHGWSLFDDGTLVIFRAASNEPTRVHPMQIWRTPFTSPEHAAQAPSTGSHLERIGNAELVRGISDALSVRKLIAEQQPSVAVYEDLIAATDRMLDSYYWLDHEETGRLEPVLREVRATSELIIDEFEKVQLLERRAAEAVRDAETRLEAAIADIRPHIWTRIDEFVTSLSDLRSQRGQLISLREMRYVDVARLEELEARLVESYDQLSGETVRFLLGPEALAPYRRRIGELEGDIEELDKVADAHSLMGRVDEIADGLALLTEIVGGLEIDDATVRTEILEHLSEVLASLNRTRALAVNRRQELLHRESVSEFGVQYNLFGQTVTSGLNMADTPERCDEQLSRLMLQLEELEGRFGEFDQFLEQLNTKREEVYEAVSSKKQVLVDQRNRRAQQLVSAADRILEGVVRRAGSFANADELNAYFASDAMVSKVRELGDKLRELGDSVKADEVASRLKSARQEAGRVLRDRIDIYEEGAEVIRLGRHRFSVNTQPLELTIVPRGEELVFHLSGTDFFEPIKDAAFAETRDYWEQELVSETPEVYRAEYLVACLLADAEARREGLSLEKLQQAALSEEGLLGLVRRYAAERYDEGYERGIHDADAALILEKLLGLYATADLLRYTPRARAAATLFWTYFHADEQQDLWQRKAQSLVRLRSTFAPNPALEAFGAHLGLRVGEFCEQHGLTLESEEARAAGVYLVEEISREPQRFVASAGAVALHDAFRSHLDATGAFSRFEDDLRALEGNLADRYELASAWLEGFLGEAGEEHRKLGYALEQAAVLLLTGDRIGREVSTARVATEVEGLLGQHPRIDHRKLELRLDEFLARLARFRHERVRGFRRFQAVRHQLLARQREELRLDEYRARVMSTFVRNRLISDVYLPLIGDNLAKQIGALGEGKRTDLMGLLLLISPPGYGKTTLMEYIASRLGLVFMKINGPALGHSVTSLDPEEAPNRTARQEIEKVNLAFEMGNNVLLYVDDIQHTHSEFLQKFISLCDAQRRVEGVWRGRTRTYDLRGKKFCVCMAGNPYTESGERFQIPDMLANRADTYNLGDILVGRDELFALSYVENALTSSSVLAPLATREPEDTWKLARMAAGEAIQSDALSHGYSQVELNEILSVLRKLFVVRDLLLAVNRQYILSASQEEAYRTEPRFQLQGSYRNMNKIAEKTLAVMNDAELAALIDDHYAGEAQTLTTGAEHNLLKLAELRGTLTAEQAARWDEIKRGFARVKLMGGDDDPATRVSGQIGLVSERLDDIRRAVTQALESERAPAGPPSPHQELLRNQAAIIDATLIPLLRSMAHQLKQSKAITDSKLKSLMNRLEYTDTLNDLLDALKDLDVAVIPEAAPRKKRKRKTSS